MRTVMRPRYYCDHCKKGSGSPSAMRRHESSCTVNPSRVCRMCALLGLKQSTNDNVAIARKLLEPGADYVAIMASLRWSADDCPACILAALRLSGATALGRPDYDDPPIASPCPWRWDGHLFGFDFRSEMREVLTEHNSHSAGECP